ncbi:MAG: hypothetical protein IKB77_01230, partial [Lentisphaeria bacterium]|nr:hypothetical protein [Lentisphaeria bacterium]
YSLDQVDGNLTLTVENFIEDTTPPEKPQASANITTPTKRNVTVTAVFSNDSVVREYSLDGENWLEYERGVVFEQNGTVYFRGKDAAGNVSEIAVYNVENIELRDLTLSVYGNPAKWTNNDVSLTAISNRQAQIQYSFDGQEWFDGKSVVLTENKTVYFRAVDNFGNTAEKTVYVTKIDKVAPDTPLVSADVTENTNSAVTVTAVFSSDSVVKEYSLDGENWLEYERGVVFDENGTIYFRGTDAAGNISETAVYNVDNIDKEGSILSVSGNPTEWTNKDVVLTAFASDGVIEYFDGQKWVANNSLTVTENGIYRFRVTDEAGNVTETSVVVDKIDKIAPTLEISGNPVDWTEPGVILHAEASDGIIEYFDGQNWIASANMTVYENGTYLFRVTDAAGNVTEKSVIVDKIDAIAAPQNLYGSADGVSWESDAAKFNFKLINGSGNVLTLMTNGNQLDFYGLLYGEYSAKVKSFNGTAWSETIDISSNNSHITPQYFKSDADGADDVFFADSYSNWTRGYGVVHAGSKDRWNGTGEVVELRNKLQIKDIYEGSSDYGTLVLTDYLCGDAVSADDIFSASPVEIQSVRLSQINEIFAGAGDDIIDMTSQRFEVSGSMKIHGGSGNDVIWANNGENKLFGDAGNDRIVGGTDNDIIVGGAGNDSLHGGGGSDIFVFGSDFGNDTVEQLAGGKATLIFESENVKWDEVAATYTDGKNSVTLNGDFEVEVRYGATPELAAIGAFDNFTTEKIFEDKALIA